METKRIMIPHSTCLCALFLIFLTVGMLQSVFANSIPGPFFDYISEHVDANNGFSWEYSYLISFDKTKLSIDVEIAFQPGSDQITQAMINTLKNDVWIPGIYYAWNDRFVVVKDDLYVFPIVFNVTDSAFDQTVTVWKSSGNPSNDPTNMTNWYTLDDGQTAAHEFGHMLGLYDEYTIGGTDPSGVFPSNDPSSLMGSINANATVQARHFQGFVDWLAHKDPTEVFTLRAVPEPSSFLLVGVGLVLGIVRMRCFRHQRSHEIC